MNIILIVASVVAVVLLLTGHLVQALAFLSWVGTILLIVVVMAFFTRNPSGRSRV